MSLVAKSVCALLIIYSATRIGLLIADNYRQRPRQLRQLQFALQLMENEISYAATPLPQIWVKLARRIEEPIGSIFARANQLLSNRVTTTGEAFSTAIQEGIRNTSLCSSDVEVLLTLAASLGKGSRGEQVQCIRLVLSELAVEEQKAEQERQENERLWRYLGFLTGVSLVIVLL